MIRRAAAAIQFLTYLPVRSDAPPHQGAAMFPLVGAVLGAAAGSLVQYAAPPWNSNVAALAAVIFLAAVTGCLHEDGLADVCDAVRAGRAPERILAILKDSRIGTYGAVVLICSLLLRWQLIAALQSRSIPALAAAVGDSRGAMVLLASISEPAGDGLGRAFLAGLRTSSVWIAVALSLALLFLVGAAAAVAAAGLNAVAVALERAWFHRRIHGVTGDCLGFSAQVSEIITLLVIACPLFT